MQEERPVISVSKLHISFGGDKLFTAVDDISFSINKGETLAIVGESGSGKSLTALAMIGLLPKNARVGGDIMLRYLDDDITLNRLNDRHGLRGSQIGMVFQEPMSSLNPVMKVGKQIAEAIMAHRQVSKTEARRKTIEWLEKVKLPQPENMYDRYPHQLSGGQKQRVMIAMAMCNDPLLLIADEPTTALDVTVQQEIIKLMQALQQEKDMAMVFITHDLALAATIADKMLVMYRGKEIEYGATDKILSDPKKEYTRALLACRPSPEHKGRKLPAVSDFINGDLKPTLTPQPIVEKGGVMLHVNDLEVWFTDQKNLFGKSFSYFKAVDGVSFEIKKGEVLGLVGESGCGKSTLSRSLMGLQAVHSGKILFEGKDLASLKTTDWREMRRQIQMIFQDPYSSLNPRMRVGDILMEPMKVHGVVPIKNLNKEALRLLNLVQLPADSMNRYPHQFSGGQRQRIGIARALSMRPKLLICDESVSALDVSVQAQILNLLKELQAQFQLSYLFISHDLSVVHYISDRVMVMQAGKIVEQGEAGKVLNEPKNEYTKRLIAAMP